MKMYWLLTDLVETLFTYLHTHKTTCNTDIHTYRQTNTFIHSNIYKGIFTNHKHHICKASDHQKQNDMGQTFN